VEKRPANARARTNYATVLLAEGRIAEAEQHLRSAVAIDPRRAEAQLGLGVALAAQRRFDDGLRHLRTAFDLAPDNPEVNRNLGEAHASQGAMAEAVHHYNAALSAKPDDVMLLNRMGWILATSTADALRDGVRARRLAERAVQITEGLDAESLDTLAAAQAETGDFESAAATARRALDRARIARTEMVPELERRLDMYQGGRVFRQ
jgi:tetratricopeptide (TPR) repeat protein